MGVLVAAIVVIVIAIIVTVRVFMGIVIVGVIMARACRFAAGHRPEHAGADDRDHNQRDAAAEHERMKLLAEQEIEHALLNEIQRQANHAERPRQRDHADLVEEISIVHVMMVVMAAHESLPSDRSMIYRFAREPMNHTPVYH
jgi:hypothetical protein